MSLPPDIARLIYEALAGLGDAADAEGVIKLVRRLDHGLPAEDEFSVVCAWLGRCEVIHKLDQQQTPPSSRVQFQVPDLLAKFEGAGAVLIEVKVCNDQTLSFKPEYYQRLRAYSDMVGLPLLVAWKFHSVWTLFELQHARLARVNYNVSYGTAMKQNLLGVLAGDVAYVPTPGAGIHLQIAKEKLIQTLSTDGGRTETWQMRVRNVEFTRGGGQPARLHPETAQLLATLELESDEEHSTDQIRKSFVVPEAGASQFAHRALVALLEWEGGSNGRAPWRSFLTAPRIVRTIEDFEAALTRALDEGVVTYVLHQRPVEMPKFIQQ
jgi:Holliday junction resolvase